MRVNALGSLEEEDEWVHDYVDGINDLKDRTQSLLAEGRDQVQFDQDGKIAGKAGWS